jgi:DnaJ-class molecular chaperone
MCDTRIGHKMKKPEKKKKEKCKNCEGRGMIKSGDKSVRCKRCNGTGIKP